MIDCARARRVALETTDSDAYMAALEELHECVLAEHFSGRLSARDARQPHHILPVERSVESDDEEYHNLMERDARQPHHILPMERDARQPHHILPMKRSVGSDDEELQNLMERDARQPHHILPAKRSVDEDLQELSERDAKGRVHRILPARRSVESEDEHVEDLAERDARFHQHFHAILPKRSVDFSTQAVDSVHPGHDTDFTKREAEPLIRLARPALAVEHVYNNEEGFINLAARAVHFPIPGPRVAEEHIYPGEVEGHKLAARSVEDHYHGNAATATHHPHHHHHHPRPHTIHSTPAVHARSEQPTEEDYYNAEMEYMAHRMAHDQGSQCAHHHASAPAHHHVPGTVSSTPAAVSTASSSPAVPSHVAPTPLATPAPSTAAAVNKSTQAPHVARAVPAAKPFVYTPVETGAAIPTTTLTSEATKGTGIVRGAYARITDAAKGFAGKVRAKSGEAGSAVREGLDVAVGDEYEC